MKFFQDLEILIASYYELFIDFLPKFVIAIIACTLIIISVRFIRKKIVKVISIKAEDKLLANFVDQVLWIISITIVFLLFLYMMGMKTMAGSILGAAGVSAFILGFAFKDIGENFLAGIILAFKRPFRLGDIIKTGDVEGTILEMNLRDTHIKTADGKDVYVPNGLFLKNPLFNYTIDGFLRGNFTIGIDYGSDVEKVRGIIQKVLNDIPGILKEAKPPRTHVKMLNVSTIDIEVFYWIDTFDNTYSSLELKSVAQTKIIDALTLENIVLPASIVEVVNRT